MKKLFNFIKRVLRNPATQIIVVGIVGMIIKNPQLIDWAIANPWLALLFLVIACIGFYVDPKTPGVTDDERSLLKELLDVLKVIFKIFADQEDLDVLDNKPKPEPEQPEDKPKVKTIDLGGK